MEIWKRKYKTKTFAMIMNSDEGEYKTSKSFSRQCSINGAVLNENIINDKIKWISQKSVMNRYSQII